jgi:hypothetical protein
MSKAHDTGHGALVCTQTESANVDAAWDFLKKHEHVDAASNDLRLIRRKVDWHIVPLMFCCYTMQFLDKVILNVNS